MKTHTPFCALNREKCVQRFRYLSMGNTSERKCNVAKDEAHISYPRTFLTILMVFGIMEGRERDRIVKLCIQFLTEYVNGWAVRTFPNVLCEVFSCAYVS
jgi:hypothetical protein